MKNFARKRHLTDRSVAFIAIKHRIAFKGKRKFPARQLATPSYKQYRSYAIKSLETG